MDTRKRRSKSERIRQIIDMGKYLLLEKGFTLTAKEIADRIGVSETYIYSIYPNKKAIITAIYEDHFKDLNRMIQLGEANSNYRDKLQTYFTNFYRQSEKSRTLELLYLLALEKSDNRPNLSTFQSVVPSLTRPLEEFLRSGLKKGYFRENDPVRAADFIHSAFFHLIYHHTLFLRVNLTDEQLDKIISDYIDLFLTGILRKQEG
jgi:AcrR family transcriptional regulator